MSTAFNLILLNLVPVLLNILVLVPVLLSLHLIMRHIDLRLTSVLTSVLTSSCHTPGTLASPATPLDRVTSKRPKNNTFISAYLRSGYLRLFEGGHLSGLKSNRQEYGAQGPIYRSTCRYFSHTAV